MSQPKKNSIVAQASTEINSEAAIKLFPQSFPKTKDSVDTIEKDGTDGETGIEFFTVEVALNGFLLTIQYEDGSEVKTIHDDFDEVLKNMRGAF